MGNIYKISSAPHYVDVMNFLDRHLSGDTLPLQFLAIPYLPYFGLLLFYQKFESKSQYFLSHNKPCMIVITRFDLISVLFRLLPNTFSLRLFLELHTKFAHQFLCVNKFLLALLEFSSFSTKTLPFLLFFSVPIFLFFKKRKQNFVFLKRVDIHYYLKIFHKPHS